MKPWTTWQDWSTLALGVLLLFAPLVTVALDSPPCTLGSIAWFTAPSTWDAWIVGIVLVALSIWALARPLAVAAGWLMIALGAWLFAVPWILGFVANAALVWTAWAAGMLVVVLAVWKLLEVRGARAGGEIASQ